MNRLKILRKEKLKTQQQMATMLGISQQAYATYENDTRMPPLDIVSKLADYFEVTVDYLLGRTDSPDLALPKEIENMQFAFHGGINTEGLSKEDIDTLKKMAEFMRSNKN